MILLAPTPAPNQLSGNTEVLSEVECAGCHDLLMVHQPDERLPDRLLGTCPSCSRWYLIDAAAAMMVRLPSEDELRHASVRPPGGYDLVARLQGVTGHPRR